MLEGVKKLAATAKLTVLQSDDLFSVNTFETPTKVAPQEREMVVKGKQIIVSTAPYSFTVLRVKIL
jgi:alpha-L-arabinofuranosidase